MHEIKISKLIACLEATSYGTDYNRKRSTTYKNKNSLVLQNMPLIIAVSSCHKAQGRVAGGTLDRGLGLAVSAPQASGGAVSRDVHQSVVIGVPLRRFGRGHPRQLHGQGLSERLLEQRSPPSAPDVFLVQEEGVHDGDVYEVVEKSNVPPSCLVGDLVIAYQGVR